MAPKDGFPQSFGQSFSARSAWRGIAGYRKLHGTPLVPWPKDLGPQDLGKPPQTAGEPG
jgi:hypothetical protein